MQQIRKRNGLSGRLMTAKKVQVDLKSIFCISWNFSCVLHNMPLEKNVSVTYDDTYHTLIQVADEHRSHYDKTVKNFGYLLMHENAPKQITNCT